MQYNDWECPLRPNVAYIPYLSCRAVPVAENVAAIEPDRCRFSCTCIHVNCSTGNAYTPRHGRGSEMHIDRSSS